MKKIEFLFVLLFFVSQQVFAQDVLSKIDKEMQTCFENKQYTTAGMTECTYKTISKLEKEIKIDNSKILKILKNEQKYIFYENHKKWEVYKNSQINLINGIGSNKEGTIYQNIVAGSIVEIYKDRIKFLQELLNTISN